VRWTAPANSGSAITGFSVRVANAATNVQVDALRPAAAGATSPTVTGLVNGTAVRFQVQATNAVGTGALSALSIAVTPATVPGVPVRDTATWGGAGGAITATANWTAPASHGGSTINGYVVQAIRLNAAGTELSRTGQVDPGNRAVTPRTPGANGAVVPSSGDCAVGVFGALIPEPAARVTLAVGGRGTRIRALVIPTKPTTTQGNLKVPRLGSEVSALVPQLSVRPGPRCQIPLSDWSGGRSAPPMAGATQAP
jgi:Fibronectin type III domain